MIRNTIFAALLASSAVVQAQPAQPAQVQAPAAASAPAASAPVAAPATDPARLSAARQFIDAAFPPSLLERAFALGVRQGVQEDLNNPEMARRDPHLAERLRILERVILEETSRVMRDIDPNVRSLLADYYARRLTVAELNEGARFYASPAGARFYDGVIEVALDPEYNRAMQALAPQAAVALAGVEQRFAAATASLPPFPGAPAAPRPPAGAATPAPPAPPAPAARRSPPAPPAPAVAAAPLPPADPARLAAARHTVDAMWPADFSERPLNIVPVIETLMTMRVGDFGVPVPPSAGIDANATLGQVATRFDPHFAQRVPVVARFAAGELARITGVLGPEWKRVAANFYAREFTAAELESMSGYFGSTAGQRMMSESYRAIEDPALVRGLVLLMPRLAMQIPTAMQRVEQATAHLPAPAPAPGSESEGDDHDHGGED